MPNAVEATADPELDGRWLSMQTPVRKAGISVLNLQRYRRFPTLTPFSSPTFATTARTMSADTAQEPALKKQKKEEYALYYVCVLSYQESRETLLT